MKVSIKMATVYDDELVIDGSKDVDMQVMSVDGDTVVCTVSNVQPMFPDHRLIDPNEVSSIQYRPTVGDMYVNEHTQKMHVYTSEKTWSIVNDTPDNTPNINEYPVGTTLKKFDDDQWTNLGLRENDSTVHTPAKVVFKSGG